jgi:hypothetical protein
MHGGSEWFKDRGSECVVGRIFAKDGRTDEEIKMRMKSSR